MTVLTVGRHVGGVVRTEDYRIGSFRGAVSGVDQNGVTTHSYESVTWLGSALVLLTERSASGEPRSITLSYRKP
jgi:hypothetical protein